MIRARPIPAAFGPRIRKAGHESDCRRPVPFPARRPSTQPSARRTACFAVRSPWQPSSSLRPCPRVARFRSRQGRRCRSVHAAHAGKLYAGSRYWEDRPGPEGRQGSQILLLNAPGARRPLDHDFDERQPDGRDRDLAVSALSELRFATDGSDKPSSSPVSLLIAANWDLSAGARPSLSLGTSDPGSAFCTGGQLGLLRR